MNHTSNDANGVGRVERSDRGPADAAPLVIARVAPRPVETIQVLRAGSLLHVILDLQLVKNGVCEARERVSVALHGLIGGCEDKRFRRALVEARRRLYNGQPLTSTQVDALAGVPSVSVRELLAELEIARAREREMTAAYELAYVAVQAEERAILRTAVLDEALGKGIALSSASLYRALSNATRDEGATYGAREAHTERGLLRYLTRMVMKATPFGTFCHVIPVRTTTVEVDEPAYLVGDVQRSHSTLRLNKRLYGAVWLAVKKRSAVRAVLRVRVAPTLERVGKSYQVLAAIDQRETFQRVPATPLLDSAVGMLCERKQIVLGELVDMILAEGRFDAGRDEVTVYLERLIDLGFLQVCAVVREQDAEWDGPVRQLLASVDDDAVRNVASSLCRLRESIDAYPAKTAAQRAALLATMRAEAHALMLDLGVEGESTESPLFEDVTAPADCVFPIGPQLDTALKVVATLGELLVRLSPARVEHATMRRFWEDHYKARSAVPLLEFYHDYYRLSKKERLAGDNGPESFRETTDPYRLELGAQLRTAIAKLRELVTLAWRAAPTAEEMVLDLRAIGEALANVPPRGDEASSLACFLQVAWKARTPRIVMRQWGMLTGCGKYFSRFLDILPKQVLAAVRQRNGHDGSPHAEVLGDAFFNANLHPTLLSRVIAYPTSDTEAPPNALAAHGLDVSLHPDDANALRLRDRRTGLDVIPVDLGFLVQGGRPPLYQLMVSLGNAPDVSLEWPDGLSSMFRGTEQMNDGASSARAALESARAPVGITYRPRIVLADVLVVARRRWRIPAQCIPRREYGEQNAAFLLRLTEWRLAAGIPVEGYVMVHQTPTGSERRGEAGGVGQGKGELSVEFKSDGSASMEGEHEARAVDTGPKRVEATPPIGHAVTAKRQPLISRDASKPQYIHFGSPVLSSLFERLGGALDDFTLDVEERYPADDDLLKSAHGHHSYELLMQFDDKERRRNRHETQADVAAVQL